MLTPLRRGSAFVARPFFSHSAPFVRIKPLQAIQARQPLLCFAKSPSSIPTFATSPPSRQYASQSAALEEEEAEAELQQEAHARKLPSDAQTNQTTENGPVTKFEDLGKRNLVSDTLVKTLTQDMKLDTMTEVQSWTINESLKGVDILAQARTGTGKTLAFLIPTLQNIINYDPSLEHRSSSGRRTTSANIRAIIISPTRELAEQIAVEARKLTRRTGVIVQTAVGGSSKAAGLRAIRTEGCHVLVGTPGRLKDILSDEYNNVRAPNLSAFVLDEADRLLDQGFAPEIEEIQRLLPDRRQVDRQTLLYSATVPREVMQVVRQTMKPNFKFVRTVQEGEAQTHERVVQKIVNVGGFENSMPALVELCQRELSKQGGRPFKAIVYFSATAEVSLAAAVMRNLKRPGGFETSPLAQTNLIEMHARLTQQQRTRAAEQFKRAPSAIMLSSDVTARGMDFPNVTHVLQIGLPPTTEQYVHRIGRTARAGQEGEGWIFINNLETREARYKLRGLPLQVDQSLETTKVDMSREAQLPEHAAKTLTQVGEATSLVPRRMKAAAYMANLGMYSWVPDKQLMVDTMNNRAKYGWGMADMPKVSATLVAKLGLRRVRGVEIGFEERKGPENDDRYRGGSFSRFGRDSGGDRGGYGGRQSGGFSRGSRYGDRDGSVGGYGERDYGDRSGFGDRSGYGNRSGYGDRQRGPRPGALPRGDMGEIQRGGY